MAEFAVGAVDVQWQFGIVSRQGAFQGGMLVQRWLPAVQDSNCEVLDKQASAVHVCATVLSRDCVGQCAQQPSNLHHLLSPIRFQGDLLI
jgi:hypothetical protein